ncbi:hypothetical protein AgCh_029391 [Apium graveolens]
MEIMNLCDDSRLVKTIPYNPHEDQAQINGGRIKTRQLDDETRLAGNQNVMVCEQGTMFGYSDLIVDPRNLEWMREANCSIDELEAELEELKSAELEEESL